MLRHVVSLSSLASHGLCSKSQSVSALATYLRDGRSKLLPFLLSLLLPGPSFSGNIPGKQVNKSNWHIPGEQVKLGFSQHISCQTPQFQVKLVMVFAYRIHALHKHACWNAKKRVHEHAHRNARTHFFLHQTLQLLLVHTQCFLHRAKRQLQSMVRSADSRNLADVIFIAPARRASMA